MVREGEIVVSSSVLMCLGALTPILTSDTEFVSTLDRKVIKYRNLEELKVTLLKILKEEYDLKETIKAAEKYAIENSQKRIAERFIRLFEELQA